MRWNDWTQLNDFIGELDRIAEAIRTQEGTVDELRQRMKDPSNGVAAYLQENAPQMASGMEELLTKIEGLKRRMQSMLSHTPVHY